jgi:hypothetical protein
LLMQPPRAIGVAIAADRQHFGRTNSGTVLAERT